MCRFEKNLNKIYTISGIVLIIIIIMAMSSCGSSKVFHIGTGSELSKSNCSGNYIYNK